MDANDLRTMLDYNGWARARMLDAVKPLSPEQYARPLGNSFSSLRDTIVHLYGAEWIWMARIEGTSPTSFPTPEQCPDPVSLQVAWRALDVRIGAFAGSLDAASVHLMIEFKTLAGQSMASPVWQIVQHVTNHSTYHRGQVTTLLRQLGARPPQSMDMIAYYREKAAA